MRGWLFVSAATVGAMAFALGSFACRKAGDEVQPDASAKFVDLGKPCKTHAECQQGVCVAKIGGTVEGGQGVCSLDCSTSSPCLAGWQCVAQPSGRDVCQCGSSEEVCDRADNDCNGIIDDAIEPCDCVLKPDTCSGLCVDLQTDAKNCGRCGTACPPNAQCSEGACTCAPGAQTCATGCADLRTDEANCGACDVHCGSGATCVDGTCRCDASGEVCKAAANGEGRSFCGTDGACRTAAEIPLGSECTSVAEIVGHPNSVAVACKRKARQPFEIYSAGATGASLCGTGFKPRLSTNGSTIFFSSTVTVDGGTTTELFRCPAAGQAASVQANLSAFSALNVGADLYWVDGDKLRRCPVGGCTGAPVEVATVAGLGAPMVSDATNIYAIQGSELVRIDATNGALTSLATVSGVSALVLDSSRSRLLVVTPASIGACPTTGCPSGPSSVVAAADVTGLSVDASRLWWKSGNAVYQCPATGTCTPTKIFETAAATDVLGADELGLYVGGERLERIAK